MTDRRPSPDALLRAATRAERGKLKIFLGAAPGVGKTFEMLREGAERLAAGIDVVIGVVETHGRRETEALVAPLPLVARAKVDHRGHILEEMDLDALLARAPRLALVDELAHTNVEGSRHAKRWQDVAELLDAGIDVLTTLNVQHVESLNDVVASFTRVRVRETVPDHVLEGAEIEMVDLPPDELIERLKDGKVYVPAEASRALGHFFSKENLSALREMALRRAALNVDRSLLDHLDANAVAGTYAGGERVLVAVSELPGGDALVRAGKRLADALRAPWQVVHIETPRSAGFTPEERARVAEALRLAAGLGATIATIAAESVVEGVRAQIAGMRATQLVIGRSRRSWWFELRHPSVVETLLRESEGLALHILPASAPASSAGIRLEKPAAWQPYAAAGALVGIATGIATLAEPVIGGGAIDLIYLLPVILTSIRYGRWPGIAAGAMAGLAYNFFFLPPVHTFTIADPQSVLTVAVLLALAVFVSTLAERLRNRASVGSRSAQENAAVAAFGQALARSSNWQDTAETVCAELSALLDASVLLLAERDGALVIIAGSDERPERLGPVDRAAADWAWSRGEVAGNDTNTLNAADWQFHPLKTALGTLALIGLARSDGTVPVAPDRRTLLATLLGQAALAHERLKLEGELRDVSVVHERDRLRSALLSSIGHDLRTPLSAVSGAIDAIGAAHPDDPSIPIARRELIHLRHFLNNLLEMVRLDTGALVVRAEPVDLVDAVAGAVRDLRGVIDDRNITIAIPGDLPLVKADPILLHHMLLNLLSNAATHGGGRITIEGRRLPDRVDLAIVDQGPGIGDGDPESVFRMFAQGTGSDRAGGSGIGLAIVRGFAEAQGLIVKADRHADAGARFTISFGCPATGG